MFSEFFSLTKDLSMSSEFFSFNFLSTFLQFSFLGSKILVLQFFNILNYNKIKDLVMSSEQEFFSIIRRLPDFWVVIFHRFSIGN